MVQLQHHDTVDLVMTGSDATHCWQVEKQEKCLEDPKGCINSIDVVKIIFHSLNNL